MCMSVGEGGSDIVTRDKERYTYFVPIVFTVRETSGQSDRSLSLTKN